MIDITTIIIKKRRCPNLHSMVFTAAGKDNEDDGTFYFCSHSTPLEVWDIVNDYNKELIENAVNEKLRLELAGYSESHKIVFP